MNDKAVAVANGTDPREMTLLRAIGFDRLSPEQRELALNISKRYELDPMLKHVVMVDGRPYITRDGLLHVAHRSGQLDGIETTEATVIDGFWRASCSVYRKDMSRPFTYSGRYPTSGGNQKFAPEMAVKVAEVMALRRAFDVAAPVAEERWDLEAAPTSASAAQPSLAERAAQKRAAIVIEPTPREAASEPSVVTEEADDASMSEAETAPAGSADFPAAGPAAQPDGKCGNPSPFGDGAACGLPAGHPGKLHRELGIEGVVVGSWPTT